MGQKLMSYFEKAGEMGGLMAKMRLAVLSGIASAQAMQTPDSPENIKKFEDAIREIEKQFKK